MHVTSDTHILILDDACIRECGYVVAFVNLEVQTHLLRKVKEGNYVPHY